MIIIGERTRGNNPYNYRTRVVFGTFVNSCRVESPPYWRCGFLRVLSGVNAGTVRYAATVDCGALIVNPPFPMPLAVGDVVHLMEASRDQIKARANE